MIAAFLYSLSIVKVAFLAGTVAIVSRWMGDGRVEYPNQYH